MHRSPFHAPELPPTVRGRIASGRFIHTSGIVKREGNKVWTESGSEYELGEMDPEYKEWLKCGS